MGKKHKHVLPMKVKNTYELEGVFNRYRILKNLMDGKRSVSDLVRLSDLSRPTVQDILNMLMENGLVIQDGYGPSRGGRKPALYTINAENIYAIGIDFAAPAATVGVINGKGQALTAECVKFEQSAQPDYILRRLAEIARREVDDLGVEDESVLGVGVGLPGSLDKAWPTSSTIERMDNWKDVKVAEQLADMLGWRVFVENDASAMALAELWFGGAKNDTTFLYIAVREPLGIGLGVVNSGQVASGANGNPPLFGHTIVSMGGPKCTCGAEGCLEAYLSSEYLARFLDSDNGETSLSKVLQNADFQRNNGLRTHIARILGLGLGNLVKLFDPSLLVIGGDMGDSAARLAELVAPEVRSYLGKLGDRGVRIVPAEITDLAGMKGAGTIVFHSSLCQPQIRV